MIPPPLFSLEMGLPLTGDPAKKRVVVEALLKMKEAGLLGLLAREWAPRTPAEERDDDLAFRPASLVQVLYRDKD